MSQHKSLSAQEKNFRIDTYPELYAISSTTYPGKSCGDRVGSSKDIIGRFLFLALSVLFFAVPRQKKTVVELGPNFFWVAAAAAHHVRRMGMGKGRKGRDRLKIEERKGERR